MQMTMAVLFFAVLGIASVAVVESACAEVAVRGVCDCGHYSTLKGYQCNACKDVRKWGYGCDLDCPSHCPFGCDFVGNCAWPDTAHCKRNARTKRPSTEVLNERHECRACESGWFGIYCKDPCPANCKDSVEGLCTRAGKCYACKNGFFGPLCSYKCPAACSDCVMTDTSRLLNPDDPESGYLPAGACSVQCKGDSWGPSCNQACPTNCRKAGSKIPSCLKETGLCIKCKDRWWGQRCERPCSAGCADGLCIKETGVCEEEDCNFGWWGSGCDRRCPDGCLNNECDKGAGVCSTGCKKGFWGVTKLNGPAGTHQLYYACTNRCPSGSTEKGCDPINGKPLECAVSTYLAFVTGSGYACISCPWNCAGRYCDDTGNCVNGCEVGFHGSQCSYACPRNCKDGCEKISTGLPDGECKECQPGFRGQYCTEKCHASCRRCEIHGDACLSCHPDQPSTLQDGKCVCITGAEVNPTTGLCECIAPPEESRKVSIFERQPTKVCRSVCKEGYIEFPSSAASLPVTSELVNVQSTCLSPLYFDVVNAQTQRPLRDVTVRLFADENRTVEVLKLVSGGKKLGFFTTLSQFTLYVERDGYVSIERTIDRTTNCPDEVNCAVQVALSANLESGDLHPDGCYFTGKPGSMKWEMRAVLEWDEKPQDLDIWARSYDCYADMEQAYYCKDHKATSYKAIGSDPVCKRAQMIRSSVRQKEAGACVSMSCPWDKSFHTDMLSNGAPNCTRPYANQYPKWVSYISRSLQKLQYRLVGDWRARTARIAAPNADGWTADNHIVLDIDKRTGFGPETVTFRNVPPGLYQIVVDKFTLDHHEIMDGHPRVNIYLGGNNVAFECSIDPRCRGLGTVWNVVNIEIYFIRDIPGSDEKMYGIRIIDDEQLMKKLAWVQLPTVEEVIKDFQGFDYFRVSTSREYYDDEIQHVCYGKCRPSKQNQGFKECMRSQSHEATVTAA